MPQRNLLISLNDLLERLFWRIWLRRVHNQKYDKHNLSLVQWVSSSQKRGPRHPRRPRWRPSAPQYSSWESLSPSVRALDRLNVGLSRLSRQLKVQLRTIPIKKAVAWSLLWTSDDLKLPPRSHLLPKRSHRSMRLVRLLPCPARKAPKNLSLRRGQLSQRSLKLQAKQLSHKSSKRRLWLNLHNLVIKGSEARFERQKSLLREAS